jgi:hypothetical protein
MQTTFDEEELIRQIDNQIRELDVKLDALENRKKRSARKKASKQCQYPISEIGGAFNYLNNTTTAIGNKFEECLIATHSKIDAQKCLHRLTNSLSSLNCKKITSAMTKCKGSTNIPEITLQCLDKASSPSAVNSCIGKSINVTLSSHIAKGSQHIDKKSK